MSWSFDLLPFLGFLCAIVLFIHKLKFTKPPTKSNLLPPGPPGLPLVGNLLQLGVTPHRTFLDLRSKYGPVIWLRFGTVNTMVVQSADAAAELFRTCDIAFADKSVPDCLFACGYNEGSVVMGKYGPYWRKMRRIMSVEFLMHKRVNTTRSIRENSMEKMVTMIKEESEKSQRDGGSGEVEVGRLLFYTAFDTIGNVMLSEEVMEAKLGRAGDFFEAFEKFLMCVARPNLADFFPILKWIDPQGIRKRTKKYLGSLLEFGAEIVRERIRERQSGQERKTNDFLDTMLDEEEEEGGVNVDGSGKLTVKHITIVLVEMFFGGTETTSTTIEWGMAELLRHPIIMHKIQDEIDTVVGRTRLVSETDLDDLPYLKATIKEILRLHPPIHMLMPRKSIKETEFMGYVVPKDTQVIINAWGIHRDPEFWPDPLSFKPERFLDSDVDFKGQHFQMLPFGSGRRSCSGLTLGLRMVTLSIACLVQGFDWNLAGRVTPEMLDMQEVSGLTLNKKFPLKAIPTPRV